MFILMDKKIITILRKLFLLNWPYEVMRILHVGTVNRSDCLSGHSIEDPKICFQDQRSKALQNAPSDFKT